ncbi:FAD-dependent monooxygenase [Streptosporangium sp. NBC_01756]|uniref:FAD-dependent monooxygenase n=1 Tax=Streptosporangium sp. NBC_01756 TaxID=2975950 RepID=UPI002DD8CDD7|nr:FAD-dependent monooxygenase [Streptosporangium sp. NBC_01756]WSC89600.1 FAD-dependent monooxygenase [Streptosporangium sp. NBC_01756]
MTSPDVLIVGAGPAGLALACGLRLHGVPVRVIDKAAGPAVTSRANFLHARGAEVLDRLGALGDLPNRAISALTITVHAGGKPISTLRFGDAGLRTSRPALLVSQAAVEAELRRRLAELGVTVQWNTALVEASADDDGVTAVLADGRSVRVGWLAGCDGAHSTVRKLAGIGFPGVAVADQWLLADVYADGIPDRSGSHGWLHRDGLLGALPMRPDATAAGDLWRLMAYLPGAQDEKMDQHQIVDHLHQVIPRRTGLSGFHIHDTAWTSLFRIHRRLAEDYRRGRILLAGDAAHIHSPIGGQGMLTGIGDAENLAWKLALVTCGKAAEALLDTYQAERRPLAAEVLRTTSANTRFQTGDGTLVRFLRERVMAPLLNRPWVQRWATAVASQLWVSYRRGPLAGTGVRFGRRPRPGDRVPDVRCRRSDGTATRLHAELGGHWVLLSPGGAGAEIARTWLGGYVTLLTTDNGGFDQMLLIRPDAHLAWRGRPRSKGLQRWLAGALRSGKTR